jgi:hypothetical protein
MHIITRETELIEAWLCDLHERPGRGVDRGDTRRAGACLIRDSARAAYATTAQVAAPARRGSGLPFGLSVLLDVAA